MSLFFLPPPSIQWSPPLPCSPPYPYCMELQVLLRGKFGKPSFCLLASYSQSFLRGWQIEILFFNRRIISSLPYYFLIYFLFCLRIWKIWYFCKQKSFKKRGNITPAVCIKKNHIFRYYKTIRFKWYVEDITLVRPFKIKPRQYVISFLVYSIFLKFPF